MDWPQESFAQAVTAHRSGDIKGVLREINRQIKATVDALVLPPPRIAATVIRAYNVDYIVDPLRDALLLYTNQLIVQASLLSGSSHADVNLLINGVAQGQPGNDIVAALSLGLSISTPSHQKMLVGFAPGGAVCNLTTTTSGSGTATMIQGVEILL